MEGNSKTTIYAESGVMSLVALNLALLVRKKVIRRFVLIRFLRWGIFLLSFP
jgi:hypothetical protein